MSKLYDIAIIGGGPSGIFAAYYAGLRNLNVVLIESLDNLGGAVAALYPQKKILDIAGYYAVPGQDLINDLVKQMNRFPVDVLTSTRVVDVVKDTDKFTISTEGKVSSIESKTVIVATGSGSFTPIKPPLENIDEIVNVDYFVNDLEEYKDKEVAILGGGDSAVDLALMLNEVTKNTTVIHRRDAFRALETSVDEMMKSSVNVKTPVQVQAISNIEDQIELVLNDDTKITVDKLLVAYGFKSDNQIIDNWSVKLDKFENQFKTNPTQQSNVEGLFIIGDASGYPGKADLIATGFGEAPTAVNSAVNYFNPELGGPVHSTALGIK